MIISRNHAVVALFALHLAVSPAWCQDTEQEAASEAMAYLQGYIASVNSRNNFDVMLRGDRQRMYQGDLAETSYYWRIVGDLDEQKFLLLGDTRLTVASPDPEKAINRRHIHGFFVDGQTKRAWLLREGDIAREVEIYASPRSPEELIALRALRRVGFAELRLVGISPFPALFVTTRSVPSVIPGISNRPEETTINRLSDNVVATKFLSESRNSITSTRKTYHFDVEKIVPLKMIVEYGNLGDFRTSAIEEYSWDSVGPHIVPIQIVGERIRERSPTDATLESEHYTVDLKWNVINDQEKLPPLESTVLADREQVIALLKEAHVLDEVQEPSK